MDLVMPGQEGLETIPQIKAAFPAVKIVAMSGAFRGAFLAAARALGADEAITKPIAPEALVALVHELLGE